MSVHSPRLSLLSVTFSLGLLFASEATTAEIVPVCDRTPLVRDEILGLAGVSDCADVTEAHLAKITSSFFYREGEPTSIAGWPTFHRGPPPPIKELKAGDFSGLISVKTLFLDCTPLTTLPAGVFAGLSSLQLLDLAHTRLTSLPEGVFAGLPSLRSLDMSSFRQPHKTLSRLTSLPVGVFAELSSLQTLDLSGNALTSLPAGVFDELVSLEELNLTANSLTSLPVGIFAGLSSLQTLDLSGNALTSLPAGVFDELVSLEELNLTANSLTSLPVGVFAGLSSLQTLDLSRNALTSLPAGVFSGLASLQELDLTANSLTSLPVGVFAGLSSLQSLDLLQSQLTSLPAGVFSGLASLQTLDLSGNNLATLPEGIFSGLASLEVLHLAYNGLTSLPEGIFSGLISLEDLTLGTNRTDPLPVDVSLDWIDPGRFQVRVHTGAPFEVRLPIIVTNGTLDGASSHVTIPTGREASDVLSVSRRPGTTAAVTVEIERFPDTPQGHTGYVPVKAALPLPVLQALSLDFPHFANGESILSELVFVNVAVTPIRPAFYFFDTEGDLIAPDSVLNVGADRRVLADGSLTVQTEIEPLGELTISTHGLGPLVTGSVRVMADGPIGGVLRFDSPEIGVAGVGTGSFIRDAVFPARRQESGINTGAAIRNLGEDPMTVSCQLLQRNNLRDEVEFALPGNGQTAQFINELFTGTYTGNFVGAVRCSAEKLFTGVALEMDSQDRIFTTLPMVPVPPMGAGGHTQLYFPHFANGESTTSDFVLVNFTGWDTYSSIAIYFYDGEGHLIPPESVVDLAIGLRVRRDGALTTGRRGEFTISTHGRGDLVTGSVKIISSGPIGGFLRFNNSEIGVAGVSTGEAVQDAIFPARHQVRGIRTGMAIRNLKQKATVVNCQLMRAGRVLEEREIPLSGNGQTAQFIDELFATTIISDFEGSVRCTAPDEGSFTGLALEIDAENHIFTTLPVVPIRQ